MNKKQKEKNQGEILPDKAFGFALIFVLVVWLIFFIWVGFFK